MAELIDSISAITHSNQDCSARDFELRIKLFTCITKSALRDTVQLIGNTTDEEDRLRMIREFRDCTEKITASYRELRTLLLQPAIPENIMAIYNFADEYLSLMIEGHTYQLLEIIGQTKITNADNIKSELIDVISNEIKYRKRRDFPSIPVAKLDNENLIFRRNVLKKYSDNVLFLDVRTHSTGQAVEQSLFGLAAGISMFFCYPCAFLFSVCLWCFKSSCIFGVSDWLYIQRSD